MSSKSQDLELPPHITPSSDRRDSDDTNTSNATSANSRQVKKRNRIPVSCNEYRRRKLRFSHPPPSPFYKKLTRVDVIVKTHVQHVSNEAMPIIVNSLNHS